MALKSLIFDKKGDVFLSSLKRYALSAVVVPKQDLLVANIPAGTLTNPGRSVPIPLQGPADAATELYSLSGRQAVVNQGVGVITTTGGNTTVTGTGTKFLTQLQVDTVISTAAGSGTVTAVLSDTVATTLAPMAANTNANYFFSVSNSGDRAWLVTTLIEDQAWRRRLMNRDVPVQHVFGSNTKPEFIKESLLLETDQTLLLTFFNYSGSPTSFAENAEGRKWQYNALKYKEVYNFIGGLRERKQYLQPYWLTLDRGRSASIAAGATGSELLTCTGDITLVLFNCYAQAYEIGGDTQDVTSQVTVEFEDASTHRNMQTQPVPLNLCAGTAENPYRLPSPWILQPQTFIRAKFKNTSNVSAHVFMTFHGVAIYTGTNMHGSTLTNENLRREAAKMYQAMSTPQIRAAEAQG